MARAAIPQLAWLRTFFSELFALPLPTAKGALSSYIEAQKTAGILRDAGISNLYEVGTWRQSQTGPETMAEKRRRVYSSFSPKLPRR